MTERVQLERRAIASIVYDPRTFPRNRRALEDLTVFSDPLCRRLMEAILRCADGGLSISFANVVTAAKVSSLESSWLIDDPSLPGDLNLLARALAEESMKDHLGNLRTRLAASTDPFASLELVRQAESNVAAIVLRSTAPDKHQELEDFVCTIKTNRESGVKRIPTGLSSLDGALYGGLSQGNISLLGGEPGAGKTSLAAQIALNAAQAGHSTCFIEAEMPAVELLERLNGIATGADIDEIRSGRQYDSLTAPFVDELFRLPLMISICGTRTLESLTSLVVGAIGEGAQLIVVDYLQVFSAKGRAEDEYSAIKAVSERLRQLALVHRVHIMVLSSLNRNEIQSRRPGMASFYGSSQLAHDAAVCMVLTAEINDADELASKHRSVTLRLVKNRHGRRGDLKLDYDLPCQRFTEAGGVRQFAPGGDLWYQPNGEER